MNTKMYYHQVFIVLIKVKYQQLNKANKLIQILVNHSNQH